MKSIEELAAQLHGSEPNRVARENGDRWLTLGQVHRVLELIQKCGHVVLPPDEREFGELRDPVVWLRWMALGGGTEAQERRYRAAFRQCADIIEQSTARIEALEADRARLREWYGKMLHQDAVDFECEPWIPPATAEKRGVLPGEHTDWPCMTCLVQVDGELDAAAIAAMTPAPAPEDA